MNFLIIEGDFPFWRGFLVEEWKRLPHRTHLLSQMPKLWRPGDYDTVSQLPMQDGRVDADRLRALVEPFGPLSGALTVFEPAVGRTLEVQRALDLPVLSTLEPRALRNKAAMVEAMTRAGLAVPKTVSGADLDTVVAAARAQLSLPVVVKPAELAGKAGVKLVEIDEDLAPAVAAGLAETLPFEIDGTKTSVAAIFGCERTVLVQEYIDGPEYSVEGYAAAGRVVILAVTEKLQSGPPLFEELGHLQPARLEPSAQARIEEYARATSEAFGLRHCCFHLELRLAARGPVMMEINCRLAGDLIPRLLELRSGMNVGDILLRIAASEPVAPPQRFVGTAGVRMATTPRGGTLRAIRPPLLRSDREFAVFEVGPGDPVHPPKPGGATRVGYFLVAGDDAAGVDRRLDELAQATEIVVDSEVVANADHID